MTTNINPFARLAPADGSPNIHHYINGQLHAGTSPPSRGCLQSSEWASFRPTRFGDETEVDLAVSAASQSASRLVVYAGRSARPGFIPIQGIEWKRKKTGWHR